MPNWTGLGTDAHDARDHTAIASGPADTSASTVTAPTISATAVQLSTTTDRRLSVPVTFNPTAVATAACTIGISPDNATFTVVANRVVPLGAAFAGTIDTAIFVVPAGWWVKTTSLINAVVGTAQSY